MDLLERIRSLCRERGTTIATVERAVGFNKTIYNWAKNSPSIDKVEVVADYFGVSIDELIGRQAPGALEPEQRRLLALFAGLNADGQTAAIKQLEFLALQPEYIKSDRAWQELAKMES